MVIGWSHGHYCFHSHIGTHVSWQIWPGWNVTDTYLHLFFIHHLISFKQRGYNEWNFQPLFRMAKKPSLYLYSMYGEFWIVTFCFVQIYSLLSFVWTKAFQYDYRSEKLIMLKQKAIKCVYNDMAFKSLTHTCVCKKAYCITVTW